jgi:hypothetical protein
MVAHCSFAMVILPMYVVSDCPADRHPLSAGHYWKKPTVWNHKLKDVSEKHSALTSDEALFSVKADKSIQPTAIQQHSAIIQANITVTAPITKGQHKCFTCY